MGYMTYGHICDLQEEIGEWAARNFGSGGPDKFSINCLLGMQEELGELSHAVLKHRQGIRGMTDDVADQKARDAWADLLIYALDFAHRADWDGERVLWDTWNHVKARDWKVDPETAHLDGGTR